MKFTDPLVQKNAQRMRKQSGNPITVTQNKTDWYLGLTLAVRMHQNIGRKLGLSKNKYLRIRTYIDTVKGFGIALKAVESPKGSIQANKHRLERGSYYVSFPVLLGYPVFDQKIFVDDFELESLELNEDQSLVFYIPFKNIDKFQGKGKGVFSPVSDFVEEEKKISIKFKNNDFVEFTSKTLSEIEAQDGHIYDLSIQLQNEYSMLELINLEDTDNQAFSVADVRRLLVTLCKTFKKNNVSISGRYYQY